MTREELKEHCKKQIEMCEMWAIAKGENPPGKVYEEHKMILELLEQEPCEDAISRQAVNILVDELARAISDERCCISRGRATSSIMQDILDLPPVNPQEPKWDRLYSWLNDMRLGIAPDETVTDIDERNVRTAQVDLLDEIMEWIEKHPQEPKTGHWIEVTNGRGGHECDACHDYAPSFQSGNEYLSPYCPNCGAKMESEV